MNPTKLITILLVVLFLGACNKDRPEGVLSETELEAMLYDLYVFEGAAQVKNITFSDSTKTAYYNQIFRKHHTSQAQFDSSMVWYYKNPKQYKEIQTNVIEKIELMQAEVKQGKFIRPIAPSDSLDSIQIKLDKRDIFISPNGDKESAVFILPDTCIHAGESLLISYGLSVDGDVSLVKSALKTTVYYKDSSRVENSFPIHLIQRTKTIRFILPTNSSKQVSRIRVNLFNLNKPSKIAQAVYVNNISMQRLYNPYRKLK